MNLIQQFTGFVLLAVVLLLTANAVRAEVPEPIRQEVKNERYERAETILKARLNNSPDDQALAFWLARVLAWQSKHEQALSTYNNLLERFPENTDYLLGKAQVLYWSGHHQQALDVLRQARRLAPDYAALYKLEIKVLQALDRPDQINTLRKTARDRFPQRKFPEPESEQRKRYSASYRHEMDRLTAGFADWHSNSLTLRRLFRNNQQLYVTATRTERFELEDARFGLGGTLQLSDGLLFQSEFNRSHTHNVLPATNFTAAFNVQPTANLTVTPGWSNRDYRTSEINMFYLRTTRYFGSFSGSYTLYRTVRNNEDYATSHLFMASYHLVNWVLTGGLSTGKSIEETGPDQITKDSIESYNLGVKWNWLDDFDLVVSGSFHEQGNRYERTNLAGEIIHHF